MKLNFDISICTKVKWLNGYIVQLLCDAWRNNTVIQRPAN